MCALFELMYHALAAEELRAELFCNGLMRALLVKVLSIVSGTKAAPAEPPGFPCVQL